MSRRIRYVSCFTRSGWLGSPMSVAIGAGLTSAEGEELLIDPDSDALSRNVLRPTFSKLGGPVYLL